MKKLAITLVGAAVTVAWALVDRERAIASWTAAFAMALSTAIAAFVLIAIFRLAHAKWWLEARRSLFGMAELLPLAMVLFVPIALSRHQPAFLARSLVYAAVFAIVGFGFVRRRKLAAPGLLLAGFGFTFAALDWFMALEAHWTSNVYGLWLFSSGLVAATSIFSLGARRATHETRHAIGRLLFASVFIWAYLGFFQLLIVWMADLPHEVGFYRARIVGGWAVVSIVLGVGRFAIPFLLLLSRRLKTTVVIPIWLLATTALDFAWVILPSTGASPSILDLAPLACICGLAWFLSDRVHVREEAAA